MDKEYKVCSKCKGKGIVKKTKRKKPRQCKRNCSDCINATKGRGHCGRVYPCYCNYPSEGSDYCD